MGNKELARSFDQLAKIMEFQGENHYKIRSYQRISGTLKKLGSPLAEMSMDEINAIEGVGKAIAGKIQELLNTGTMQTLERYKSEVPQGILEMLNVKGIGPKKIKAAWKELGVESATELLYACNENRLVELKGFGAKTQQEVRRQLEFFLRNRANFLHINVKEMADHLMEILQSTLPSIQMSWTGSFRRCDPVLDKLELLIAAEDDVLDEILALPDMSLIEKRAEHLSLAYQEIPLHIYLSTPQDFVLRLFASTGPRALAGRLKGAAYTNEEACFDELGIRYLSPEARALAVAGAQPPDRLVRREDILGVVHAHSLYSDGVDGLEEMAAYCKGAGYQYFVVTDHSQIAVYANGVSRKNVIRQWEEIDQLNNFAVDRFRILKGIECDILNDGNLDYDDELLAGFEVVIASIHTNIRMNERKATDRIIRAVESPHTNMLGHPTGRLLLGREGYPLDMAKIIDACAANRVAIELNASPYRLDLDWRWIAKAREKEVLISINPDAHAKEAINYVDFGVKIARKGWLDKEGCLNARDVDAFLTFCGK
ncbi:MAG: DNA polymerase/3'-5' exonuclease PolX [Saprospiraceae bacterium]|nr:DNA polymerase/3'-5' exonuclease PolX [Saprospiraceae bacterium]